MANRDAILRVFLRVVGSVSLLAAPCAMMPYVWMNAIHGRLGMGELPAAPVVGYLARSTSAFYAVLGGLLWVLSTDLPRYRPVLNYAGGALVALGVMLGVVDWVEGMPLLWCLGEAPVVVLFGLVILSLNRGQADSGGG